ncbi:MAG: acyltransferase, partial [Legionella longbeachae]|nr:acyltransferase [Legionella longbeachae]
SYKCFLNHIKQRKSYNPKLCDFDFQAKEQQWQDDLFLRMQKKYVQLIIIDPKKVQCPKGRCKAEINGVPVFRDSGHITDYASYQLASSYLKQYKNPFLG